MFSGGDRHISTDLRAKDDTSQPRQQRQRQEHGFEGHQRVAHENTNAVRLFVAELELEGLLEAEQVNSWQLGHAQPRQTGGEQTSQRQEGGGCQLEEGGPARHAEEEERLLLEEVGLPQGQEAGVVGQNGKDSLKEKTCDQMV